MFWVILFLLTTALGGFAITYLYDDDATIPVRLAAGVVLGNAAAGIIGFILSCLLGLNWFTVGVAALICGAPILIFTRYNLSRRLQLDLAAFSSARREFVTHLSISRVSILLAYLGLVVMLWFFFERAMLEIRGGIGTGSTHNIGDLPFHLLVINNFVAGQNFPPQNPVYAGVAFTYPYMTDLVTAMMNAGGASISEAMFGQNFVLGIALIVLIARFTYKLTGNINAALIAPFLLLFDGGFGFLLFLRDAAASHNGIIGQLFNLTVDYTIRGESTWRWGNSLTSLFLTQRAFLLGLPLALIVLTKIWELFTSDDQKIKGESGQELPNDDAAQNHQAQPAWPSFYRNFILAARPASLVSYLVAGLLAGLLPLIHAHTFAVVMGMSALIAAMSWRRWREWIMFFGGAGLIAVPELLLATMGSAAKADSFIGWEFGWDNGSENVLWFWFKNTGLFIPLLGIAIVWLSWTALQKSNTRISDGAEQRQFIRIAVDSHRARQLLLFYAPFLLCFIVPNLVRLAPWVWDNVKVLIYWFVASTPLVALVLASLWQHSRVSRLAAGALLITLTFSGWLDVWRVASRQYEYQIISPAMVEISSQIRARTKPREIMLGAPDYSNLPVLTGRRWFLGWTAHVWSHGINSAERENIIRQIYAGGENAEALMQENNIHYVIIGPLERKYTAVNEEYFRHFPVLAEVGEYKVYQVD